MAGDIRSSYTFFPLLFTYCAATACPRTLTAMCLPTSAGIVSGFHLASFHYKYVAKLGKESKFPLGKEETEES